MSNDIKTIKDSKGNVWTGRVAQPTNTETIADLVTGTVFIETLLGGNDRITIEVNGEKHTGIEVTSN